MILWLLESDILTAEFVDWSGGKEESCALPVGEIIYIQGSVEVKIHGPICHRKTIPVEDVNEWIEDEIVSQFIIIIV